MSLETFLLRMPKVELDVHLEAALRPASLLTLASKHGIELPACDEAGLRRWLRVRGFEPLAQRTETIFRCLRDGEDFRLLALEYAAEAAVQNVLYCEVRLTVSAHLDNGVHPEEMGEALREGALEAEARYGTLLRLVPSLEPGCDAGAVDTVLEWSRGPAEELVAGVGVGADDAVSSDVLGRCLSAVGESGLACTVQGGEGLGGIREAVESLTVKRLAQAVHVADNPALLRRLEERGLPLVLSPSSGMVLASIAPDRYPFDRLCRRGLTVCVNSDRPQLLDTNLTREYVHLHRAFGYDATVLASLSLAGVESCLLPEVERRALEERFKEEFRRLGEKYLGSPVSVGS